MLERTGGIGTVGIALAMSPRLGLPIFTPIYKMDPLTEARWHSHIQELASLDAASDDLFVFHGTSDEAARRLCDAGFEGLKRVHSIELRSPGFPGVATYFLL